MALLLLFSNFKKYIDLLCTTLQIVIICTAWTQMQMEVTASSEAQRIPKDEAVRRRRRREQNRRAARKCREKKKESVDNMLSVIFLCSVQFVLTQQQYRYHYFGKS